MGSPAPLPGWVLVRKLGGACLSHAEWPFPSLCHSQGPSSKPSLLCASLSLSRTAGTSPTRCPRTAVPGWPWWAWPTMWRRLGSATTPTWPCATCGSMHPPGPGGSWTGWARRGYRTSRVELWVCPSPCCLLVSPCWCSLLLWEWWDCIAPRSHFWALMGRAVFLQGSLLGAFILLVQKKYHKNRNTIVRAAHAS